MGKGLRWGMLVGLVLLGGVSCGGASPSPESSGAAADGKSPSLAPHEPVERDASERMAGSSGPESGSGEVAAAPEPRAAGGGEARGSKANGASRKNVLAALSDPPGAAPLSEGERVEVKTKCRAVSSAIAGSARRDRHKKKPHEYVEAAAKQPPRIAGVDVPRCMALIVRDVRAHQARRKESMAGNNLKRIMVALASAMSGEPGRLCGSTKPVPAELDVLRKGPHLAKAAEWKTAGWACLGFTTLGAPQHFQYQLAVDAKQQRYQIVARGFVVQGQPASELYLAGKIVDGAVQMSSDVYRR